jgi:hypothetical protein
VCIYIYIYTHTHTHTHNSAGTDNIMILKCIIFHCNSLGICEGIKLIKYPFVSIRVKHASVTL